MMRLWGAILLLAGTLAWAFDWHLWNVVRRSSFGYEFGSVAWPVPVGVRIVEIFALLLAVIGLSLFVFDLVQGIRGRLREETR